MECANCGQMIDYVHNELRHSHSGSPFCGSSRMKAQRKPETDWNAYRKCSQICGMPTGQACVSVSGAIAGGRPDGVRTELAVPHRARKRRTRQAVK